MDSKKQIQVVVKFSINREGIAHLVFDQPNMMDNVLSFGILKEFEARIDELKKHKDIRALVISSAKENIFITGPDIKEISAIKDPGEGERYSRIGQQIFNKLESLPFPSIAVIDGACLSGGLELALACTYRIASDNPETSFGFPMALAIFPGFGGTQRLPHIMGLEPSIRLLLNGKPLNGPEAYNARLVDECYPAEFFPDKIEEFVNAIFTKKEQREVRSHRKEPIVQVVLEKRPASTVLFREANKMVREQAKDNFPALFKVLEVIENTYGVPLAEGLKTEAREWGKLAADKNTKNILGFFFGVEKFKKDPGVKGNIKPADISSAGVIGAGNMGWGIAWCFTIEDIPTRLKSTTWGSVGRGISKLRSHFKEIDKLNKDEIDAHMRHLLGKIDYSGFEKADIVVEAVYEDLNVKKKVYAELEKVLRHDAIIATNTSSLTIEELSKDLKHPERFVGMHFCGFSPPDLAVIVEVIPGEKTSAKSVATVVALCKKLRNNRFIYNKIPLVVKDCPGFFQNRVNSLFRLESLFLLQEGADVKQINYAHEKFGLLLPSPFDLFDMVGFDINHGIFNHLVKAYFPRFRMPELFKIMYEDYHIVGRKRNKGFYLYDDKGNKKQINPELKSIIADCQRRANIVPRTFSDKEIIDRSWLCVINEASLCLEEKVVESLEYIDLLSVLVLAFPASRSGIFHYVDEVGIKKMVDRMQKLSEVYGERFAPSSLLKRMAKKNKRFFPKA